VGNDHESNQSEENNFEIILDEIIAIDRLNLTTASFIALERPSKDVVTGT
jgi:hypothetical protein